MAALYSYAKQKLLMDGLPSRSNCDQAVIFGWELAMERSEPVVLDDGGEFFILGPNGSMEPMAEAELEFWK